MAEPWVRLVVVLAVVAIAVAAGAVARRGRAWRRRRVRMPGLGPGLVLFTAATCATCEQAREVAASVGVEATEVRYEDAPEVFSTHRIERVPALASLDADGRGWLAEGIPSARRLRRWLGSSG